jgi:hypothetical protein
MTDANVKRSPLITAVIVLQLLLGLLLAVLTGYLLALTRARETLADSDAAETIHGLLVGAAVLGVPALITLAAVWGLWKRRFWGWLLSLATDVGMLGVLFYSIIDDRDFDLDMIALTAACLVPAILLLLPQVRQLYWHAASPQSSVT